jgi:hypothetical protein
MRLSALVFTGATRQIVVLEVEAQWEISGTQFYGVTGPRPRTPFIVGHSSKG